MATNNYDEKKKALDDEQLDEAAGGVSVNNAKKCNANKLF